jgi:hypothetical protein
VITWISGDGHGQEQLRMWSKLKTHQASAPPSGTGDLSRSFVIPAVSELAPVVTRRGGDLSEGKTAWIPIENVGKDNLTPSSPQVVGGDPSEGKVAWIHD